MQRVLPRRKNQNGEDDDGVDGERGKEEGGMMAGNEKERERQREPADKTRECMRHAVGDRGYKSHERLRVVKWDELTWSVKHATSNARKKATAGLGWESR